MKNMTLKNITAACHGTFHGDSSFLEKEIIGVAIDSRKAAPGFLFVPLKGARVDGTGCTCYSYRRRSFFPYLSLHSCRILRKSTS